MRRSGLEKRYAISFLSHLHTYAYAVTNIWTRTDWSVLFQVGEVEQIPDEIENKVDDAVQDVEDFPENVAEWTGEKVGEVEQFGSNIENDVDSAVDDVEEFGDNMENAYDEGKQEAYEDDY
ncbi:hypothetical protein BDW72DRAFT_169381 [Aspergillus terricola var. indicus]